MFRKNALLSVFNKRGIEAFAHGLCDLGWTIYSSGGTAKCLRDAGIAVTDVASLVGGGAILGHKVVTLSREVHAGLLAYDTAEDTAELERLGIPWIDLVCVDLYPLDEAIRTKGDDPEAVRDMTDIGGPTMLRSAAKGRRIVIADPNDRSTVLKQLAANGDLTAEERNALAAKAEYVVSKYCLASARYTSSGVYDGFHGRRVEKLKYGENPQQDQDVALYTFDTDDPLALDQFVLVDGKTKGWVNNTDLDREVQTACRLAATLARNLGTEKRIYIAIGVKHGNACGVGISFESPQDALAKLVKGNPKAISGGFILTNFDIGLEEATLLKKHMVPAGGMARIFDGIFAPSIAADAIPLLQRKDGNHRLMVNPALLALTMDTERRFRCLRGGFQVQSPNPFLLDLLHPHPELVITGELTSQERIDAVMAKAICDSSTSNTITFVKDGMLLANGTCRPSRSDAVLTAKQTAKLCGLSLEGSVVASDSFFPAEDGPQEIIDAGVRVVVTTSGSRADERVFKLFTDAGIAIAAIPNVIGRGFDGH